MYLSDRLHKPCTLVSHSMLGSGGCVDKITLIFVFANENRASTPYHEHKSHVLAHQSFAICSGNHWHIPVILNATESVRVSKQSPSK